MNCPFMFTRSVQTCDKECALRVKISKTNIEAEEVIVGDTCALAAMSCNLIGVTFAPAFIEVLDRIDLSEVLNEEENCLP